MRDTMIPAPITLREFNIALIGGTENLQMYKERDVHYTISHNHSSEARQDTIEYLN